MQTFLLFQNTNMTAVHTPYPIYFDNLKKKWCYFLFSKNVSFQSTFQRFLKHVKASAQSLVYIKSDNDHNFEVIYQNRLNLSSRINIDDLIPLYTLSIVYFKCRILASSDLLLLKTGCWDGIWWMWLKQSVWFSLVRICPEWFTMIYS